MKRPRRKRPPPPTGAKPSTVTTRTSHSTLPKGALDSIGKPPVPARRPPRPPKGVPPSKRQVARIVDDAESSLLDLIDNLLAKGVMLSADLVLALANVDLIYVRLSALLCAADRVLGPGVARRRGPVPPKRQSREGG